MKLIDADDFLKTSIENKRFAFQYKDLLNEQIVVQTVYSDLAKALNTAPTIDAVEVVRCKDCVYWDKATVNRKGFLICPASGMEIMADDYCSYGKRKENT